MCDDNIYLQHVQVDVHGKISAKVEDDQSGEYEMMAKEMNRHYANDQMVTVIQYNPNVGELCAGSSKSQWYRVIVRNKLSARNGIIAVCYFVDEGFEATIPVAGLRHLSPKFCELPRQVKSIHLHGIQPCTMRISPEDTNVVYGTCKVWDESAVKFMTDMITAALKVRCTVMDSFSDGTLSVRMFLRTHSGGLSCLNETMVRLGYAVNTHSPDVTQNSSTPASDETALLKQILGKHRRSGNNQSTDSRAVRSDSEFYSNTADKLIGGDPEYETDNLGVSAISHRRFQQSEKQPTSPVPKTLTELMKLKQSKKFNADDNSRTGLVVRDVVTECCDSGFNQFRASQRNENSIIKQSITDKSDSTLTSMNGIRRSPLGSVSSDTSSVDLPSKGRGALLSHLSNQKLTMTKSPQSVTSSVPPSSDNSDIDTVHGVCASLKSISQKFRSEKSMSNGNASDQNVYTSDSSSRRQSLSEKIRHMKVTTPPSAGKSSRTLDSAELNRRMVQDISANSASRTRYLSDSCTESDSTMSRNDQRKLAKLSNTPAAANETNVNNLMLSDSSNVSPHYEQHGRVSENRRGVSSGSELSASNLLAAKLAKLKTIQQPGDSSDSDYSSKNRLSSALSQHTLQPFVSHSQTPPDQTVSGASCDERLVQRMCNPKTPVSSASNISGSDTESSKMMSFKQKLKARSDDNQNGATNIASVEEGAASQASTEASTKIIKMLGNRVLQDLQNAAKKSKSHHDVQQFSERCHDVLIQGYRPPKPVYNVRNAKLAEHVQMAFVSRKFADLTLAQAFSWPAITRGRHVVTVAPPGSGKTLAYLCPLVSALCDPRVYHQVARNGKGPFLIVLSLSWTRARCVYDEVMKVIGGRHDLNAVVIHGGAQMEKKLACKLINGCDILVATPPCLTRTLQNGYIDLRRLCNLVVDDADQTLATFRSDIGQLLQDYDLVIKNDMRNLSIPRQILCFGAQWNSAMNAFMNSNLIDPILIITSLFEASIYGHVKQVTHMCQPQERMRTVLGILENIPDDSLHPVIIFASAQKDLFNLYKTLQSQSRSCLIVHKDMDTFEVHRVSEQWPVPLLVCWDEFTAELGITDATTVIHYDLPNSKTKFGNRLGCMRKYFYNFSKKEQAKIQPTAHLLVTPNCHKQLKTLSSLLSRVECEKTEKFKAFLDGAMAVKDENDSLEMCSQTMAFGMCRDGVRCKLRHKFIPEVDCTIEDDWLPREGEVEVKLSYVQDASHYFVRILSVKYPGTKEKVDLSTRYTDMLMKLSMLYSKLKNKKRYNPELNGNDRGRVCGYEENEVFHRVQIFGMIVNKDADVSLGVKIKAEVFFVDTGAMKSVPAYRLYELPDDIASLPFQAIEVFVCKIRPVDKDTEWTSQANMFIHDNLKEERMVGNVLLRVGRVMWLDPLLLRKYLPLSHTVSQQFYVHEELVRNGYADRNPDHLKRLCKLCEGKVDIPTALLIKSKQSRQLDTDTLPATRKSHIVYVSSVSTPDLFFVQRNEKNKELETMMTDIGTFIDQHVVYTDITAELKVGSFCLAQYTNYDQRWYRAKVLKINEEEFEVFFADYGDSDTVPKHKVRELPVDRFYELPLQAIECKLADIVPIVDDWEERCGDVIWDLTHYVNSDLRDMTAVVRTQEPAQFGGMQKLVIELSTRDGSHGVNIGEELAWQNLAKPAEEGSDIQPLFPRPVRSKMKFYPSLMNKITDLCAAVYYETDESKALKSAEEILSILSRSNVADCMVITDCVASLVKLIGRVQSADVHEVILNCCVHLIEVEERLCDVFIQENLTHSIIRCLEMNSDVVKQQQATMFIAQSCIRSVRLKGYFLEHDKLQLLLEVLGSSDDDQVQGMVCRALAALCTGCESVFQYLMSKSICTKLQKCLILASDHVVAEGVLMLIAALTEHDSGCEELKKESLIEAIVNNLSKTSCDKCIQYSVQQCDYFASTRRKHKTFLLEHHMVTILTRIIQLDLQAPTKQLCRDLLTSLVVKVPSEPLAGTTLRSGNQPDVVSATSGVPPDVKWVQNTFRVVLKVNVSGVQGEPEDIVSFTDNSVTFSATVDGVCYYFKYQLFDTIIEQKCTVEIGSHTVAISMKKQKEGKWSRLLHQKAKPAHLSVDYENWVDSSSDSEVCDDEQPFVLKKKQRSNRVFKTDVPVVERNNTEIVESDIDTSDSLENLEDYDDHEADDCFKL